MKVLIVLTSHDELGDTGKKTGFWLEEFRCAVLRVQRRWGGDHVGFAAGRAASARSQEQ